MPGASWWTTCRSAAERGSGSARQSTHHNAAEGARQDAHPEENKGACQGAHHDGEQVACENAHGTMTRPGRVQETRAVRARTRMPDVVDLQVAPDPIRRRETARQDVRDGTTDTSPGDHDAGYAEADGNATGEHEGGDAQEGEGVIVRVNAKVERALREALGNVPRVAEDEITAPLAALDDGERTEALALAAIITGYVAVDTCGMQWPTQSSVQRIARALATTGTTARRLRLGTEEIRAYLSRTVLGPEPMADVIPDEPRFTRLPVIVAEGALAVYCPKGIGMRDYLDQIESAIEVAAGLDPAVLPAAVMRAYLPKT